MPKFHLKIIIIKKTLEKKIFLLIFAIKGILRLVNDPSKTLDLAKF